MNIRDYFKPLDPDKSLRDTLLTRPHLSLHEAKRTGTSGAQAYITPDSPEEKAWKRKRGIQVNAWRVFE